MKKTLKVRKYLIIFEKSKNGYGAFSPDVPGCIAVAKTKSEVRKKIIQAIKFHLEGLQEEGIKPPKQITEAELISIAA